MELTEKLESEKHLCREVSEKLTHKESDLEKLLISFECKDKEILDLEHTKTEMNKQILQQNQLLDRLRHYEAQSNVMELLQEELKESNKNLEIVMAENVELHKIITELQNKENIPDNKDIVDNAEEITANENNLNDSIRKKIESLENTNAELKNRITEISISDDPDIKSDQYLNKEKAMEQLEDRFKTTMSEIADLTEEKHRLEHLVLQLQSETETIGEYVTLYQCQRAVLKQRTQEKDEQLEKLNQDREAMKLKLEELNNLIRKLIVEKSGISEEVLNSKLLNNLNSYCDVHKKENLEDSVSELNGANENNNLGTAGQIISLLTEIKTSNLVQPNIDNIQNFHPCPCCSGKLITI